MKTKVASAIAAALMSASCAMTEPTANTQTTAPQVLMTAENQQAVAGQALTLKQIMADQDWVARSPENAYWMLDGSGVLFQQKRAGSQVRDWYHQPLNKDAHQVPLDRLHNYAYNDGVYNSNRTLLAYTFEGNIFVRDLARGKIQQLTRDEARQSQLVFLTDGRLSYRQGNDFFAIDPSTGLTQQIASLALKDAPKANTEPKDFIAREQQQLIQFVQVERQNKADRFAQQQQLQQANGSLAPEPFYLGQGKQIVAASLSPAGNQLIVAISQPQKWRDDGDIMPNYVTEDGRVAAEPVRARVADAKPVEHQILVLNLTNGEKTELTYNTLPGWNEDVLAAVRKENYAAEGKTYKSEKKPRAITLMQDWGWREGAIRWSDSG